MLNKPKLFTLLVLQLTLFSACITTRESVQGDKVLDKKSENGFTLTIESDKDDPDASDVFVNGLVDNRPYRFMLDTGAAMTSLKADEYLSKIKSVGQKDSAGAFAKHREDQILISGIHVGSLFKNNMTVTRSVANLASRRNLLGMDFLGSYALHFQYDKGRVDVIDTSDIAARTDLQDLFLGERSHPYVDIFWDGLAHAKGVWDTGAGITCFDQAFMKNHSKLFRQVGTSKGTDSTGTHLETPVYELKGFELGGKRFPSVRVVVIDLSVPNSTIKTPMDFVLGNNVINKANWIFDFPRHKWAISKMLAGGGSQ
jgi:hypothetical protein